VFLVNVPIVIAGIAAIAVLVPESRNPSPGRVDLGGVLLSVAGLATFVYGIITGGDSGEWGSARVLGPILGGALILAAFVLVREDTPIWVLATLYFVMGVGMATVVAPSTESVMSTLPREKAGVGSAVSNTFRQVGGALGVAVLGSVLSEVYRGAMAGPLGGLPAAARDAASESLAATYAVAADAGPAGAALLDPANSAYVQAMHWAAGGSALAGLLGLVAVLRWLPRHSVRLAPIVPAAEVEARLVDVT